MSNSIKELQKMVNKFSEERGWSHSDPNQLITSLMIELAELSEHYQWQSEFKQFKGDEKIEVGYEFVDVFIYLLRLADKSDIDLEKAFLEKLPKLEKKFPIGSNQKKQHNEYRKNGKNKLCG